MSFRTKLKIIFYTLLVPVSIFSQTVLVVGNLETLSQDNSSTIRCQVELTEPCELSINMVGWQNTLNWGTDYDRIYIYNSDEKPIGIGEFGSVDDPFFFHMMSDPDSLVVRIGKAGTYYIDFHSGSNWGWPEGKTSQNYTVLLSVITANDLHEANDDMSSSTSINFDEVVSAFQWRATSTDSVWGDEDWYKLSVPSPGKLSLLLNNWLSVYNWGTDFDRLYIYNSNGEPIGGQSENDPYYSWMMGSDSVTIDVNISSGGNYYLGFHSGIASQTENYTLLPTFNQVNDINEPNDDLSHATPVEFNIAYSAYQWCSTRSDNIVTGDEDYYLCNIPSDGKLKIILSETWLSIYNWGADFDRLYIYNSNGEAIGGQSETDPYYSWMMSGNEIIIDLEIAGNYTIRFHSGSAYSEEPYEFTLEFEPTTDIENETVVPDDFALFQNFPNPFNPTTILKYGLPEESNIKIEIFNMLGQSVGVLVNTEKSAGYYETTWNAENLPSGIYLINISAEGLSSKKSFTQVKKALLLK